MALPNLLSLLRMALVPALVACLAAGAYRAALAIFLVAGLSDGLDGFIARHFDQRTRLGAFLDPIADKFLLVASFVTLALHRGPVTVPAWLLAVVVGRDAVLLLASTALYLLGTAREFRPSRAGKLTTATQIAFVAVALLDNARGAEGPLFAPLAWVTLVLTLVSGTGYLLAVLRHPAPGESEPPGSSGSAAGRVTGRRGRRGSRRARAGARAG